MSAAFLLSAARATSLAAACAQALTTAPQDALFGFDSPAAADSLPALPCPSVTLNSSLRALAYAAQTLENAQASLILTAGGLPGDYAAFLLAAPEIIGARNLDPLAQLSAWSLTACRAPSPKPKFRKRTWPRAFPALRAHWRFMNF